MRSTASPSRAATVAMTIFAACTLGACTDANSAEAADPQVSSAAASTSTSTSTSTSAASASSASARVARADSTVSPSLLAAPDRSFRRGDTTIVYRVIGTGEPVLLLHGYTDRIEMWRVAADSLARDYQVIVPDLRGFGRSTKFGDPARYGQAMVDDMLLLLDHLGVRSAHVMGYSLGGLLTGQLALRAPARVRTATFVAPATFLDRAQVNREIGASIASLQRGEGLLHFFRWALPTWPDSTVVGVARTLEAANDSASLVASMVALHRLQLDWVRVRTTKVPATIVTGHDDRILHLSRALADRWPGVRFVELPGNDHAVIPDAPEVVEEFRRLVRRSR